MNSSTKQAPPKIVKCPTCQRPVSWVEAEQFKPFCCERCKLIDLGEWASEGHRIAGDPVYNDDFDEDC